MWAGLLQALAVGTLRDDTVCGYFGVNPAGYIPDGAAGAMCFWPRDNCCWNTYARLGWEAVTHIRIRRYVAFWATPISKSNRAIFAAGPICIIIAGFLIYV